MRFSAQDIVVRRSGRPLVNEVSIDFRPGEIAVITGPNGAGKSTLVSVLAGYTTFEKGNIRIDDSELAQLSARELAEKRAVMTQASNVVFDFTVYDILNMGLSSALQGSESRRNSILELAIECEVGELVNRKFNLLSGGERQRVQFCRALIQVVRSKPSTGSKYLILDEPTSSLDLYHVARFTDTLKKLRSKNVGILVVLHDLNLTAHIADSVYLIKNGELVGCGGPSEVLTEGLLSQVYNTPVRVERYNNRPIVLTY